MSVWEIIIGSVLIVFSLLIIAVVLLQEGRQAEPGSHCRRCRLLYGKREGPHHGRAAGQVDEGHRHYVFRSGVRRYAGDQVLILGKRLRPCPVTVQGAFFHACRPDG